MIIITNMDVYKCNIVNLDIRIVTTLSFQLHLFAVNE